ncbi:RNA exonuclease 1 homolog isoform X2 [Betta splendens]|uniref:RNA exonuclease 1 homolog isoform X2 n=1 Tax=Betta splendens TaxID=158456 RepID=A0A9W2Y197_BETSP|nr:RNA exonuclease 1 homolog isoform X2 [Betta splendens]
MFPSSGIFSSIECPVLKHGLCERPHCFYKHATELRDTSGTSYKASVVDASGVQDGYLHTICGTTVDGETRDDCLQELERINKEIETVRHEVEQEQRRLSHYQTVQTGSNVTAQNTSASKFVTGSNPVDKEACQLPICTDLTKCSSKARKYVVDHSKPRTDLEYDPLSNFSAVLRSCGSSNRNKKHTNKDQGLKRAKNPVLCNSKMQQAHQIPLSKSPYLEQIEDSNEDDVLIIDIPPSPEKKRCRVQELADCFDAFQNIEEELAVYRESVLLDSSLLSTSSADACKVTSASSIVRNKDLSDSSENTKLRVGSVTECLEDPEAVHHRVDFQDTVAEFKNSCEPVNLSAATEDLWNIVEVKDNANCELPPSVKKMDALQSCAYSQTNSLFCNPPLFNAVSPSRQHIKQTGIQELIQNGIDNHCSPKKMMPLLELDSQKPLRKMPGHIQDKSDSNQTSGAQYKETELSASSLMNKITKSEPSQQLLVKACNKAESSSEADFNYSDVELSDSDPMEECYRIFMEANDEGNVKSDASVEGMDLNKSEIDVKTQSLPVKKRVAHEAKHAETVVKSRPQPQVLIPLRVPETSGFTSNTCQIQQRASMLTASLKGSQTFVSSTCQRKPETQNARFSSTQVSENQQSAHLQNAYMNYIPLGTTVINMGNNLHLILPEGAFPVPVASTSSPVTPVLTPISQVHTSTLAVKQAYFPPAVATVQRFRTAAPVLIPVPAREPAFVPAQSSASVLTAPQPTAAKPVVKRKLKQQCDAAKEKVPHDVRQRYVNMFTKEFIKTTVNVNDAFEKALAEEKAVYNRSVNKLKYLSVAVNALKKLKNQSAVAPKDKAQVNIQNCKGNIPFNLETSKDDDAAFYESLTDYILTEEKLIEGNYPVQHPEKPGCATLFAETKKGTTDPLKRICCRCGATYSVNRMGKHIRKEECNYHYGKGVENRVPGGVETRYSCCQGVMGAPGCQVFKLHVHDSLSLDGFVSTIPRHPTCPGVYSLDCEMCYTVHGLELSRVTVVNSNLQVIYDTFVRPDDVIDYNTRFSGISEEDVKGNHTPLREVQQTLLSFISADTILIGHSLETDLCALKLLHGKVVDTSVVFPHRLGPPHKLTLNHLTAEYLRRIIQESVCGHDTAEDAAACMELMLWKHLLRQNVQVFTKRTMSSRTTVRRNTRTSRL